MMVPSTANLPDKLAGKKKGRSGGKKKTSTTHLENCRDSESVRLSQTTVVFFGFSRRMDHCLLCQARAEKTQLTTEKPGFGSGTSSGPGKPLGCLGNSNGW